MAVMEKIVMEEPNIRRMVQEYGLIMACFYFSLAATVFYKKSFNKSALPAVVMLIILGCIQDYFNQSASTFVIMWSILCLFCVICYCCPVKKMFNWTVFIVFFPAILDAKFDFINGFLMDYIGLAFPNFWRCLCMALPQFLRRPIWVKAKLQEVRSRAGPIYMLYIVLSGLELETKDSAIVTVLAWVSMISAVSAGIVFRPDNATILDLFKPGTTLRERRVYHKWLMSLSLVTYITYKYPMW